MKASEAIIFPRIFEKGGFWAGIEHDFEISVWLGELEFDGKTFFTAITEAESKNLNDC